MSETTVAEDLARIEGLIARARCEVAAGCSLDVSELDGRIRALCTRVGELPADRGRPLRARLLALYDELGGLAEAVRQTVAALEATLGETAKRRRAASAYGQPPGRRTQAEG